MVEQDKLSLPDWKHHRIFPMNSIKSGFFFQAYNLMTVGIHICVSMLIFFKCSFLLTRKPNKVNSTSFATVKLMTDKLKWFLQTLDFT